ncbi:hypothetical protein UK23_14885 [Lentzea aerocolonigenes]|uniref:Phage tail protein n=1 Tax=Lentzea aerocolonigenes TaxID=68170 RepID=A0A0F0H0L8_LENAE|nr:hypothetical protein UK23_14885 [Lentzea aerocolonigenes]
MSPRAVLGMAMRFQVTVDGLSLGNWATCSGLAVTFESETVMSGGQYDAVKLLPKALKYSTITLKRIMEQQQSMAVQQWLRQSVNVWINGDQTYPGGTAQIQLFDSTADTVVASWTLRGVVPQEWQGPDLSANGTDFAIETLRLAHEGFL